MNPFLIKQGANLICLPVDKAVLDRLAEAVKESRKSLGLSQRDFAELLGMKKPATWTGLLPGLNDYLHKSLTHGR